MTSRKVILIIDDNEVNRAILKKILLKEYDVIEAENGLVALQILHENIQIINGIILDILMPVMDGYEFLERIKENPGYNNIPLIVSTGQSDKESEKKALKLGAWDFVSIPYDKDIILFRLRNAIERSQLEVLKKLQYLAEYDPLTGIYNKSMFYDTVRKMIDLKPDNTYAMVRLDVQHFSLINSFYGTEEGDKLLKYIAKLIREACEKYKDVTFGRLFADEFAICLLYTDKSNVYDMINYIQKKISEYYLTFNIVIIFGVYFVNDNSILVDLMADRAKIAIKRIKGNYLNTIEVFNEEHEKILKNEQDIVNQMDTALEKGEFAIYLQPKYSIEKKEPVGSEALVRWIHPDKGIVSPGLFIPVFERNGFIEKLDYYMWEKTCKLIRKWLDEGIKILPVSVNVSRVNLYNPKIVDKIISLVDKYNIPHSLFNLELTESICAEHGQVIQDILKELHENNFVVLMDDFGNGYSSLNVLKDIDVDIIKIDMRFFDDCKDKLRGENIISSVVTMARKLQIPVVAEGVEKNEQVNFLKNIGCDYVQGYYYAKPMPVTDYENLIKKI